MAEEDNQRLGNRQPNKSRPVIIGFTTQRRKFKVLKNKGKLRGSNIFIHEDTSPEVREKEKQLRVEMKRLRAEGNFMDTITEDQMNDQQGVEIVQQTDSTNADSLSIQMSLGNIASSSATSSILRAPMLNPGLPRTPQVKSKQTTRRDDSQPSIDNFFRPEDPGQKES
ncbi:hypothetical protein M8J77_025566 [Diaphorina citri]|nr:hypothetical protein M8J77_025566 [Diaphorina citri]